MARRPHRAEHAVLAPADDRVHRVHPGARSAQCGLGRSGTQHGVGIQRDRPVHRRIQHQRQQRLVVNAQQMSPAGQWRLQPRHVGKRFAQCFGHRLQALWPLRVRSAWLVVEAGLV